MRRRPQPLCLMLLLALAACTSRSFLSAPTTASTPSQPAPAASTPEETPSQGPQIVTLWVASRFDPDAPTPAGGLLAERLDAFEASHPGLVVDVRVKEESGPGSLLATLTSAGVAAPQALPDALIMDPTSLHTATLKELLHPLEGLIDKPQSPQWYDFAVTASRVDGGFFGLPFASQAEVLAYRSSRYPQGPRTWSDLLAGPTPFLFPAGDPQAAFTLTQYLALGGPLTDERGLPSLDAPTLTTVLTFYRSAHENGILPSSTLQYTDSEATWSAFRTERAVSSVAPLTSYLLEADIKGSSAAPLPTHTEPGISPTTTWSWALITEDPKRQEITLQLLEWLSQPEFLGPWTHALGMLPPTAESLNQWPEGAASALVNTLAPIARPAPSAETRATLGPALHLAVEQVLKGENSPSAAAQEAAQGLRGSEP